jgi:transposase InsO family protein
MSEPNRYSPELRERAVRMVNDNRQDYDWFNNRRIHEPLDYVPPVEFEDHSCISAGESRISILNACLLCNR